MERSLQTTASLPGNWDWDWGFGWGAPPPGAITSSSLRLQKRDSPLVPYDQFRHVMGRFATGVTVVTARVDGRPVGMTAQSFVSLSLDPPLVMFCPASSSVTWSTISAGGTVGINILSRKQEHLSRRFAARDVDRFAGVKWSEGPVTGSPILAGAHAWVDSSIEDIYPGGDHLIVVCRVLALAASADTEHPLVFYCGQYADIGDPSR